MKQIVIKKPLFKPGLIGLGLIILSILIAMSAPLGSRIGWWSYSSAVNIMQWSTYAGILFSLLCLSGLVFARPKGKYRGYIYSLLGLAIIIPTAVFLQSWKDAKQNFPPIQDISTNIENPPEYWNAPNSRSYKNSWSASLQKEAYPDIAPLKLAVSADRAYDLAIEVIRDKGWKLWEPNRQEKHIEATEKTFWFGFSDDVIIHITAIDENRSQIDMRSTSRFGGGGDGGTNANRIRSFFNSLQRKSHSQ